MPTAQILLYLVLVLVNVTFAVAWFLYERRRKAIAWPSAADVMSSHFSREVIGFGQACSHEYTPEPLEKPTDLHFGLSQCACEDRWS